MPLVPSASPPPKLPRVKQNTNPCSGSLPSDNKARTAHPATYLRELLHTDDTLSFLLLLLCKATTKPVPFSRGSSPGRQRSSRRGITATATAAVREVERRRRRRRGRQRQRHRRRQWSKPAAAAAAAVTCCCCRFPFPFPSPAACACACACRATASVDSNWLCMLATLATRLQLRFKHGPCITRCPTSLLSWCKGSMYEAGVTAYASSVHVGDEVVLVRR